MASPDTNSPAEIALALWRCGVDAVGGYTATAAALRDDPGSAPDQIIAVGKAAGTMSQAALDRFPGTPTLVVTKDGHGDDLPDGVTLIEAAHPVPDDRSLTGGRALRQIVQAMPAGSRLLVLVSGGASSLAEDLTPGTSLADLKALNTHLLSSGLDITAMNVERRKLSRIKGGGLLSFFTGASVQLLAISDVPGDDLNVIGSGIGSQPDAPGFDYTARIVASNAIARNAAANAAQTMGLPVLRNKEALHDDLPALATAIGRMLANMPAGVIVLGGEPTVVLPPEPGRGGRNQALALALAREIAGISGLTVVVGGTDGSDGPTDAAGAVVTGDTWGTGAAQALERADSGSYLDQVGALLSTGPTGTNVMDLLIAIRA